MKFGQFIECYINNFFEKSYTKYGREISPRPFSEKSKKKMFQDQHLIWLLLLYVQVEDYQNILKLSTERLLLPHLKFF